MVKHRSPKPRFLVRIQADPLAVSNPAVAGFMARAFWVFWALYFKIIRKGYKNYDRENCNLFDSNPIRNKKNLLLMPKIKNSPCGCGAISQ